MIIGVFFVLAAVLMFLIEKFVRNLSMRLGLLSVILIVGLILSINVGITVGKSLEENRFNRNLMLIFSSLRDYEEGERGKALDELKRRMSDGGDDSKVENLLNYLEWSKEGDESSEQLKGN